MGLHIISHPPVYTVALWIPATEHSNMPPLLMKPAALTNIPHHTPTTQIISNNTSILIHINGDAQSSIGLDDYIE